MAETSTYLRLSTVHIPQRLINARGGLESLGGVIAYHNREGVWLWVPDDIDEQLDDHGYTPIAVAQQVRQTHPSDPEKRPRTLEEIERLWRYARSLGCDWIRLDADETVDPELPVYDWDAEDILNRPCIERRTAPRELTYAEWALGVLGDRAAAIQTAERLLGCPPKRTADETEPFTLSDREALVVQVWMTMPGAARDRLRELEGEGQFRGIPDGHVDRLSDREVALRLADFYAAEVDESNNLPRSATFAD